MFDPVTELQKLLKTLEREDRRQARRRTRKAEWDMPGERTRYVRELKRRRRDALLPKDRRCPSCNVVKPASRLWVVFNGFRAPMCRACAIAQGLFYGPQEWKNNEDGSGPRS